MRSSGSTSFILDRLPRRGVRFGVGMWLLGDATAQFNNGSSSESESMVDYTVALPILVTIIVVIMGVGCLALHCYTRKPKLSARVAPESYKPTFPQEKKFSVRPNKAKEDDKQEGIDGNVVDPKLTIEITTADDQPNIASTLSGSPDFLMTPQTPYTPDTLSPRQRFKT